MKHGQSRNSDSFKMAVLRVANEEIPEGGDGLLRVYGGLVDTPRRLCSGGWVGLCLPGCRGRLVMRWNAEDCAALGKTRGAIVFLAVLTKYL